jgi:hypothetical protein
MFMIGFAIQRKQGLLTTLWQSVKVIWITAGFGICSIKTGDKTETVIFASRRRSFLFFASRASSFGPVVQWIE